ncbi:unnamed protein product [Caenorhabditis angaria]|uniref:G-protein coupled receptors family 1 profile domain-containing protein n=1 Tax=Caenorhabditis angaria TaxID=860376 RepID=A0A9P1ITC9_9PELO|nr:unnamed protein product [Caenorhabditis angaria]
MLNFALMPIALIYLICAIIGVIGNLIMVIVFVKEPKFKYPCNYLITLNCLADAFHLAGHFVFNFQIFTDSTCSPATCYSLLFLTVVGYCISGPLLLAIGIDRYFSCKFPLLYRTSLDRSNWYLLAQLAFPVGFSAGILIYAWGLRDFDNQIICIAPLAIHRKAFEIYTYSSIAINCAIFLIYLATSFVLRDFKDRGATKMRQVFKSIALTVVFVLLGWTTVTLGNTVVFVVVDDVDTVAFFSIHAGLGVNVSCAINIFVFYKINTEYRLAIRSLFGWKADVEPTGSSVDRRTSLATSKTLRRTSGI